MVHEDNLVAALTNVVKSQLAVGDVQCCKNIRIIVKTDEQLHYILTSLGRSLQPLVPSLEPMGIERHHGLHWLDRFSEETGITIRFGIQPGSPSAKPFASTEGELRFVVDP